MTESLEYCFTCGCHYSILYDKNDEAVSETSCNCDRPTITKPKPLDRAFKKIDEVLNEESNHRFNRVSKIRSSNS